MDNVKIGYNIKKIRKSKHLTQKELADKIGKTESTIRKYENGSIEVPLSALDDIAQVFEINPLSLLEYNYFSDFKETNDESIEAFFRFLGITFQKMESITNDVTFQGYSKLTHNNQVYIVATVALYNQLFNDTKDYSLFRLSKLLENNQFLYPNYFKDET